MKVFITGATTGLGQIAGQILIRQGHAVVLHARGRSSEMGDSAPYVFGDLSRQAEVRALAEAANQHGPFDAVIHNAGIYTGSAEELFQVNVVAPYTLCALMPVPKRLVFMSSRLHLGGKLVLDARTCNYSDTKLFDLMLAKHYAKTHPGTFSNAVDPGWVPTRMGGKGAPDDLHQGAETQAWLAVSTDPEAQVSGKYFHHRKQHRSNPLADRDEDVTKLVAYLEELTGVKSR